MFIQRNASALQRTAFREGAKRGLFTTFQRIFDRQSNTGSGGQQFHEKFTAKELLLPSRELSGIRAFRVIAGPQVVKLFHSKSFVTNSIAKQKNLPNPDLLLTKELSEKSQKLLEKIKQDGFENINGLYLLPPQIQASLKFENPSQIRETHMLLTAMTAVKMTADAIGVVINIHPESLLLRENNPNCEVLITGVKCETLEFASADEMDAMLEFYCMHSGKRLDLEDLEKKSQLAT